MRNFRNTCCLWSAKFLLAVLFCFALQSLRAQEGVITVGLQFKPMIPMKFITEDAEPQSDDDFQSQIAPRFGMNMGMVIRKGINKMWSFETGINFVQRNFSLSITHPEMPEQKTMNYRFICYEIPLQGMVYVKLGDKLYMNASGGVSLNFYPSNIESFANARKDTTTFDYYQKTVRNSWIQAALLANYGFEWRTKKSGYYYLGVSYLRPFREIAVTMLTAEINRNPARMNHFIKGDYLTLDIRYFFHEKPQRKL